jgi:TrmH family RNA methyltransferase
LLIGKSSISNQKSEISNSARPTTIEVEVMERISSRQNPLVRQFRDVARGDVAGAMLLDGEHVIDEALKSGVAIDVAAFGERLGKGDLAERMQRAGAKIVLVTDAVLNAISPVHTPSGVVGIARRPVEKLEDLFAREPQLIAMLHDVQDPGNVGAVVRAAEGCGATGVVCSEGTADPFGWKALRGAMGSAFRLPVAARQPLAEALAMARSKGLRVFATTARGGTSLPHCDLRGPSAIIFGGEGAGLSEDLLRAADAHLTIPMQPPVESLNVAIAAALVIYEAARQRLGHTANVTV